LITTVYHYFDMSVRVIATVITWRPWRDDPYQACVTFESFDPFLDAGYTHAQLATKTNRNLFDFTLFVNRPKNELIPSGRAMFDVSLSSYLHIQYISGDPDPITIEDRLNIIETKLNRLVDMVESLLPTSESK
jgi:hypothetical protein